MARRLIIEYDRHGLRAVDARTTRGGIVPVRAVRAALPDDVSIDDHAAVGAWIREVLRDAGLRGRSAIVALGRERAALKRLELPPADPSEWPGMVELSLQRDLPFDGDGAVIDFIPITSGAGAATQVLATAIPAATLREVRQVAKAAGLRLAGVTLRALGAAQVVGARNGLALEPIDDGDGDGGSDVGSSNADGDALPRSADASPTAAGARDTGDDTQTLVIDVDGPSVEFIVLESGLIRFARAATAVAARGFGQRGSTAGAGDAAATPDGARDGARDAGDADDADDVGSAGDAGDRRDASATTVIDDDDAANDAVVTEYRRTWMSHRLSADDDFDEIVVLGRRGRAADVARRVGSVHGLPARAFTPPERLGGGSDGAAEVDAAGGWPLVGVLASAEGDASIDFLNPRRAPDRRVVVARYAGLAAVLAFLVLAAAWSWAAKDLERLRGLRDDRTKDARALGDAYAELQRERARLLHIERWSEIDPAWVEHLAAIEPVLPPPGVVVLDGITMSLDSRGVDYDRRSRVWSNPFQLNLVIEGEAADRRAADAFRAALVARPEYRVESAGSDGRAGRRLPVGFVYTLRTIEAFPVEARRRAEAAAIAAANAANAANTEGSPAGPASDTAEGAPDARGASVETVVAATGSAAPTGGPNTAGANAGPVTDTETEAGQ